MIEAEALVTLIQKKLHHPQAVIVSAEKTSFEDGDVTGESISGNAVDSATGKCVLFVLEDDGRARVSHASGPYDKLDWGSRSVLESELPCTVAEFVADVDNTSPAVGKPTAPPAGSRVEPPADYDRSASWL